MVQKPLSKIKLLLLFYNEKQTVKFDTKQLNFKVAFLLIFETQLNFII
jgi:hypothetical protein